MTGTTADVVEARAIAERLGMAGLVARIDAGR